MRNSLFLVVLLVIATTAIKVGAQVPNVVIVDKTISENGELIFLQQVNNSLELMEKAAQNLEIKGVAIMAFIPGDATKSAVSKMKVVGVLSNNRLNYLAVANSKIAEMAETFKDSGSKVREPLIGETGWRGGLIKKVASGYLLAAFSGGSEDQDVVVSEAGLQGMEGAFQ